METLKFSRLRSGRQGARRAVFAAVLLAPAVLSRPDPLGAQYRNDSAAVYAAAAAHVRETAGSEGYLLVGDPRVWGILPRRIVVSVVARLEGRGVPAVDCRLGCLEEPGDLHVGFGPIEILPDGSVWVTVHTFGVQRGDAGSRRLWTDRAECHAQYREGEWVVTESRPAWTI